MNGRLGIRIAGLLVALTAGFAAAENGVTELEIVLGQSAPFSGPAAQLGIQMSAGAKAYFSAVNQAGGIHGRQIELVTADDQYDTKLAAKNTKDLIEKEDVFALFGYVGASSSAAALPIFTQARVPFFAPFTGAPALREPFNRLIFNIRASYVDEAEYLIKNLRGIGLKQIAVFYQNDADGRAGLDGVERAMKNLNLTLAGSAAAERNGLDVSQAAAKMIASRPDAIIQICTYQSCAAFFKLMRTLGYSGQFHSVSFVGAHALADALGKQAAGVGISQVMPPPWRKQNPVVNEYTAVMNKDGIADMNFSSLEGFIAAKVLVEGLRRAGRDLTREKLIKALESINPSNFDIGFDVNFSAGNHNGSRFVDLTAIARDGTFRW